MSTTRIKRRRWLLSYDWSQTDSTGHVTSGTDLVEFNGDCTVVYGDNVSDWRNKIARGDTATTGLTGTSYKLKAPAGEFFCQGSVPSTQKEKGHASGHIYAHKYSFPPAPGSSLNTAADQMATANLLKSYIKGQTQFRGASFLAEFKDTVGLFMKPAHAFEKATASFFKKISAARKRARTMSPGDFSKLISSLWLEWSFEAKPLASDCNDAAQAFADLMLSNRADTFPVIGTGKSQTLNSITSVNEGITHIVTRIPWKGEMADVTEYSVRYYGRCKFEPETRAGVFPQFGLGVFDIAPGAWEGVPFSFLVDYFVNINDVLDGMRLWGIHPAWLNCTYRNVRTRVYGAPSGPTHSALYEQGGGAPGKAILEVAYVHRAPIYLMPIPRLQVQMPSFGQSINIAALVESFRK